ncbi:hypothetical protein V8C86DRAFT_2554978 [Haematococcus lacustris]
MEPSDTNTSSRGTSSPVPGRMSPHPMSPGSPTRRAGPCSPLSKQLPLPLPHGKRSAHRSTMSLTSIGMDMPRSSSPVTASRLWHVKTSGDLCMLAKEEEKGQVRCQSVSSYAGSGKRYHSPCLHAAGLASRSESSRPATPSTPSPITTPPCSTHPNSSQARKGSCSRPAGRRPLHLAPAASTSACPTAAGSSSGSSLMDSGLPGMSLSWAPAALTTLLPASKPADQAVQGCSQAAGDTEHMQAAAGGVGSAQSHGSSRLHGQGEAEAGDQEVVGQTEVEPGVVPTLPAEQQAVGRQAVLLAPAGKVSVRDAIELRLPEQILQLLLQQAPPPGHRRSRSVCDVGRCDSGWGPDTDQPLPAQPSAHPLSPSPPQPCPAAGAPCEACPEPEVCLALQQTQGPGRLAVPDYPSLPTPSLQPPCSQPASRCCPSLLRHRRSYSDACLDLLVGQAPELPSACPSPTSSTLPSPDRTPTHTCPGTCPDSTVKGPGGCGAEVSPLPPVSSLVALWEQLSNHSLRASTNCSMCHLPHPPTPSIRRSLALSSASPPTSCRTPRWLDPSGCSGLGCVNRQGQVEAVRRVFEPSGSEGGSEGGLASLSLMQPGQQAGQAVSQGVKSSRAQGCKGGETRVQSGPAASCEGEDACEPVDPLVDPLVEPAEFINGASRSQWVHAPAAACLSDAGVVVGSDSGCDPVEGGGGRGSSNNSLTLELSKASAFSSDPACAAVAVGQLVSVEEEGAGGVAAGAVKGQGLGAAEGPGRAGQGRGARVQRWLQSLRHSPWAVMAGVILLPVLQS